MKASRASMATTEDMARTAYGRDTVAGAGLRTAGRAEGVMAATPHIATEEPRCCPEASVTALPERPRIFDIPVARGRPPELMQRITGWVGRGHPARRVLYVNALVLNRSREIPSLRAALERADLVYCDGYGVRLAAKALEVDIPHRMTGADWIWGLAALCEAAGQAIYLLGSEPGVTEEAARRLNRWYPRLEISGTHHGFFDIASPHDDRVVEDINARRPD